MAALDFPPGTTVGQQFSAANGVVYTWNGTLWLASAGSGAVTVSDTPPSNPVANQLWFNSLLGQTFIYYNDGSTTQWVPSSPNMNVPTSPGGDFCAVQTAGFPSITNSYSTLIVTPVTNGNAGGWYSTSTGRFTPPAGRYRIEGGFSVSHSSQTSVQIQIRKNGTSLAVDVDTVTTNLFYANPQVSVIADANGTDWFDIQAYSSTATSAFNQIMFQAFSISGVKGPPGDPGAVIQTVSFQTGAVATGTTTIPIDDTIPQITEGDQYMTLAITPKSATSRLIINVVFHGTNSVTTNICAALFQDSTANALAVGHAFVSASALMHEINFTHVMTSGTTSATTFRVRAGANNAGTTTFNGSGGARLFGGVIASSIVIQEVAV